MEPEQRRSVHRLVPVRPAVGKRRSDADGQLEKHGVHTVTALRGSMVVAAASLLLLAATSNYAVAFLAMVVCGMAWDVLYYGALGHGQIQLR